MTWEASSEWQSLPNTILSQVLHAHDRSPSKRQPKKIVSTGILEQPHLTHNF